MYFVIGFGILALVLVVVFLFGACVAAKKADEKIKEIRHEEN